MENGFTHVDFTAQQVGIYSQHDWTKSIDKMKFNQLVDDAAEKFEVERAVILQILQNKQNYKHSPRNYAPNIMVILKNSLLTAKNSLSADLIGVIWLTAIFKRIFYRNLGIPLVRMKKNSHNVNCI